MIAGEVLFCLPCVCLFVCYDACYRFNGEDGCICRRKTFKTEANGSDIMPLNSNRGAERGLFSPRDAMRSAEYAVARCLSVRVCVCHSPVLC